MNAGWPANLRVGPYAGGTENLARNNFARWAGPLCHP